MFDKKMRVGLIILLVVFLIFAEKAQERTLATKLYASAQRINQSGADAYAVQINGETVFEFPEDIKKSDPAAEAHRIAEQMNTLFREITEPVMLEPNLRNGEVVVQLGDLPVATIEDDLAAKLQNTTSGIAMEWVDNFNKAMTAAGFDSGRSDARRNSSVLESGRASWYGGRFHGRRTANGETFDENALTAAHKTLPFGTVVLVTNQANGRSVIVRINDRGPFSPGRHIDLSRRAAEDLGMIRSGTAPVRLEILPAHSMIASR